MFFIDYPYVSDYLARTLERNSYPVVRTQESVRLLEDYRINFISLSEAEQLLRSSPEQLIYTNSENALSYISEWESWLPAAASIRLCKDKGAFREHVKSLYPEFFYRCVPLDQLGQTAADELVYPAVIKPSLGFFSLGVHLIAGPSDWEGVRAQVAEEADRIGRSYPDSVVTSSEYLIEECIEGDEYAVDAYYDRDGLPVLLGIYKHLFSSAEDVSDRVYVTSASLRREVYDVLYATLDQINAERTFRLFPVHAELRLSEKHGCIPIEINPARFGGWCTTADLAGYAEALPQYKVFMEQGRPDILHDPDGRDDLYSIIVLDNSTGIPAEEIAGFSFEKLSGRLTEVLECRPVDHREFGFFGFVFARTPKDRADELYALLHHDLREFVIPVGQ